jgi:hypothetical protein
MTRTRSANLDQDILLTPVSEANGGAAMSWMAVLKVGLRMIKKPF